MIARLLDILFGRNCRRSSGRFDFRFFFHRGFLGATDKTNRARTNNHRRCNNTFHVQNFPLISGRRFSAFDENPVPTAIGLKT